jgi:hypothetical protein
VSAQNIVKRLIEDGEVEGDEEFDPRAYVLPTPEESFNEGVEKVLDRARRLYIQLYEANVIQVSHDNPLVKGKHRHMDDQDMAQAVLQLALEKNTSPNVRRAYLRIKRHGRFIY